MTKEQKILLLFVLAIAATSVTFYVVSDKSTQVNGVQKETIVNEVSPITTTQAPEGGRTIKESLRYSVPDNHSEVINVTVVLDSANTITDVVFAYDTPTNSDSREYLGNFAGEFSPSLLVGKKINEAQVSRVGGASLTTSAFNQALQKINSKVSS